MPRRPVTHAYIIKVLIAGFMLVILLLFGAAIASVQSIRSIQQSVADLVGEELVATRLLDDIEHEQAALSAVFSKLSRDPGAVDREKVISDLDKADERLDKIDESASGTPEEPLWNDFQQASAAFSAEARRLLSLEHPSTLLSRDLFRQHQEALSIVAKLAAATDAKALNARQQIENHSSQLLRHSIELLGACILLALICAVLIVRTVVDLFRRMERQTSELSRVSWHMLENQETTARRFSHELHDELGQSLTAIKANLHGIELSDNAARARLEDCVNLVNEAIGNVRELSQLLHPTILDDFGLGAAIRWLAERFMQRTGIGVECKSDFTGRLGEDIETHLFRITQEALTNVARHSGATRVEIMLDQRGGRMRLSIADNGRGLASPKSGEEQGMGLTGMRARARNAGGELRIRPGREKGLTIEVEVPVSGTERAEKNQDLVSR